MHIFIAIFPLIAIVTGCKDYVFIIPNHIRDGTDVAIPVHFPLVSRDFNILLTATLIEGVNVDLEKLDIVIESVAIINPSQHASTVTLKTSRRTLKPGIYIINMLAQNEKTWAVTYTNETLVYATSQSSITMVQTDKPVYERGEVVKYRIFTIDGDLNIRHPLLDVKIIDPNGYTVDEHIGVGSIIGFQDQLQLSDISPFGTWKIQTNQQPKFEVKVILPSFIIHPDTSLNGTVKSVDIFGKSIKGTLYITVSRWYGGGSSGANIVTMEMTTNGERNFYIDSLDLTKLLQKRDHVILLVHADVIGTAFGVVRGQALIPYYKHPLKFEFSPYMQETFKPNLNPFNVVLKVTNHYGQPPRHPTEEMKITVSYFSDKPTKENISYLPHGDAFVKNTTVHQLNEDGTVVMDITIPNITVVAAIKAEYNGQSVCKTIRPFHVRGNKYLKAKMTSIGPLKVGDKVTVEVTISSLNNKETVYYIIVAKGLIIKTGEIVLTGLSLNGIVNFEITREMVPSARFIAYNLITGDTEVIADGLNFDIEDMFKNKVNIEFNQTASKINVCVAADTGSLVNVLVMDKSVHLKNRNDITPSRVKDALRQFGDTPLFDSEWDHSVSRPIVADDSFDIFENADLTFLTDMNIFKSDYGNSNDGPTFKVNGIDNAMGVEIRNDFSKTLIWYSQFASNGTITISETIPDNITEFSVSAYALSNKTGLGVARVSLKDEQK